MKKVVERLMSGATRLLVLALGLGLVSTVWAADPVAIWDGDFSVTQTGYTLDLKGNSLSSDNSIITIDQSVGITVESSSTFSGGFTVLFKYSNLNVALAAKQVLATTTLTDAEARTGVTIGTSGLSCGIWAGGSWNSSGTFNSMNISNQTAGVLGYSHYSTSSASGGTGTKLFYLKNGVATTILNASTLGSSNDASKYKGFSIGGLKTTVSGFSAATGMKITGIAVFQGVLSESELKAYVWPSAKVGGVASGAAKYTDWDYADDMVTWALDSTGELASGTAKFGLFDTHAGSIPLTFVGNANAVFYPNAGGKAEAFWHKLSNGSVSGTYKAPGMALRFSGSATGKSIGGTYGPVTIGGMYVESGASGYSLTQAGNVKRTTILGNPYDPDGVTNSVFRFEEPFTIARTGVLCLSGAINIVLPESGDALTLNKTADNGNVAYAPQIVQKVTRLSNDGIITIGTHTTPGGTLKMHGEGTIEAVQLTASGATLDFSDLGSRANATPFINCPLVVDANTSFVLPTGATFPYKVATAISGTAPTTDTVYTDANGNVFTGPFSIDAENGTVTFDPLSASTIEVNGALTISGATAANINIPAGKTLTLASGAALTGTVTGSGTVVCNQVDLSGAGFDNASGWTGKVQIAGDASMPTTYFDESSYGNANSTLEIASGHVAITAATALPGTVNVASGATLYMTSSSLTSLAISGTNNGMVNLQMAAALATLSLDNGIARGTIVYPSSLTTLNVSLTETLADDGRASFTCGGATPTSGTLTLTRPDGTTENIAGTVDGATISFVWTPAVSGAACWCAYEMEYESGVKTGFENSGSDNTALSSDGVTGSDAFTDDGMLYTYAHPWRNMAGDNAYPSSWTAVVRCTVPAYENAAVITFGTQRDGLIGLVAGADPETQMKLVKTTGNSAFTTLATMTVQNATTAQHVYVFSVENNQTIKVYCDDEQVLNKTYSTFTLGGGIQVGSVHGGIGSTGIVRFGKGESPANTLSETVQKAARIDCVRLYKTALGPNAIAQLSVEFPAVKLYRATVAANATTTWDSLTWSPTWDGGNEYSKIILTAEGNASLTLPDSITADEFTINVASDSTLTLAKATGGTAMTVSKLEIDDGTVAVADANFFDSRAINGTGTLKITGNGVLTSALSGNAKVEIPANVAVDVTTGSIANPITGAGTLAYQNALPATSPSFGDWTGTVKLPGFTADALNLNNYGKAGSVVEITAVNGGWIVEAGKTIAPTLKLSGNMTINAMSSWTYTFAEITGSGNLSFSTSANSPTVNITKVAEGYSGTISSTLGNPVTIATLDRAAGTTVTPGSKVLSTSSGVQASALTVGGEATGIVPVFDTDGLYVKAASVTKNDTTTYHDTVAAALTTAGSDDATITLLAPTDNAITLAPGQTLVNGNLTTGSVTGPDGYEVVNNNGTYTLVDNRASTWAPAENSDNKWETAANWSNGVVPNTYTAVTFPASAEGHTVKLTRSDTAPQHTCASMEIIGNVTFQRIANGGWAYVLIGGNITGSGTMTLEQVGIKSTNNVTIGCPVVGNATANDNFFSTGTFTFNNTVNVAAGEFKAEYADLVFGALVTLANGGYVKTHGSGSTATFNGGISVPENAAASLTVDSGTHTIASTVTLASGATLTVPTASTTVSGATFETSVADSYVKGTVDGSTTVYSVAAKRTATVSVGTNASLSINGNAVADGNTVKFVPGDVLTITASADTYYTPALTVNEVSQTSPYELTTTDADVTVSVTATLDTYTITIPVVANTTVSVSYTSGSEAQVATTAGNITVDAGTSLTATWTAVSGYRITAGASQTINSVAAAQTLAEPTVVANAVTFTGYTVEYTADYSKAATITATVTGDGATEATYTLTVGETGYNGTYNSETGKVTFNNVDCPSIGDTLSYTISASGTTSGTSMPQTSTVGNVTSGWVQEDSSNYESTGTWETDIAYSAGVATITDNTYTPTKPGDGIVTLTTVVKFGDDADPEVAVGTAQAALRVQNGVFEVYGKTTSEGAAAWQKTSVDADSEATYRVVIVVNYTTGTFTMTVAKGEAAALSLGGPWYLATDADKVSQIAYKGTGEFTSLVGSFISSDIEVTVETEDDVSVPGDFIRDYLGSKTVSEASALLAPDSTTTASNGYNYFSNYALGLDPADKDDKPTIKVETNSEGKFVVTLVDGNGDPIVGAANVALTLKFQSGTDPNSLTTETISSFSEGSATIDPTKMTGNVQYYKVQINIGAK